MERSSLRHLSCHFYSGCEHLWMIISFLLLEHRVSKTSLDRKIVTLRHVKLAVKNVKTIFDNYRNFEIDT